MKSERPMAKAPTAIPFDKFWGWVQAHPNCILRAGTPETILFDDDDLHWHFAAEDEETFLVQLIRGKKLLGELVLVPAEIAYVNAEPAVGDGDGEDEEHLFELITENQSKRIASYHFVLSHGYDHEETVVRGRWTH
ncbi:MAG: hypothetical protein HY698_02450 [Deltaproteobacteria bacterium]|nr:hypothetical protein [Deltaproteobacteria bacterium]